MGHIFYFFGLLILLLNLTLLSNIWRILKLKEWTFKFNKVSGRFPMKSDFNGKDYDYFVFTNSVLVITFFWLFFGLVTKSWAVFVILILTNILLTKINNLITWLPLHNGIELLRSSITTLTIGLLVFNHFHLHIDIIQFLLR